MNSFSAKDLCTRSCMQIKMFMMYPEKRPKPTQNMLEGVSFQEKISDSVRNVIDQEMVGEVYDGDDTIRFSIDIVTSNAFIEVKSVDKERELHYICVLKLNKLSKSNKQKVVSNGNRKRVSKANHDRQH